MQDLQVFIQHHLTLFIIFMVVIGVAIIIELIRFRRGTLKISPNEAVLLINRERAVVVDLRTAKAFKNGHIIDAVSLPFAELKTKLKTLKIYRKCPLLLISDSENHAAKAIAELTAAGFNPRIISGSIAAWRQADLPLTKG